MRIRNPVAVAALLGGPVLACVACATSGDEAPPPLPVNSPEERVPPGAIAVDPVRTTAGTAPVRGAGDGDTAGDVTADGALQVVSVDRSKMAAEGLVTYVVRNVVPGSAAEAGDFTATVEFLWDAPAEKGGLVLDAAVGAMREFDLQLAPGAETRVIARASEVAGGPSGPAAGRSIRGTRFRAWREAPVLTVARHQELPGTKFAGGALECVGLSSLFEDETRLDVDLKNISAAPVPANYEMNVVLDGGKSRSQPVPVPAIAPGGTARVSVPLTGVQLGDRSFRVRVVPKHP
jgi:hypothetical protein